jgi:ATP-dependent DNA helicase 2 subunit 1
VKIFKNGVFGEHHDEEEREAAAAKERGSAATQKRKAAADLASTEAQEYNWAQLADTGKVRMMRSDALTQFISSSLLTFSDNDFQIAIHAFT